MFYFYYGADGGAARAAARARLERARKEYPDAEVFRVRPEHFSVDKFGDLIGGAGLFARVCVVECDALFENEETKAFFLARLADIARSANMFVLAEGSVDAETARTVKKEAEETREFKKGRTLAVFNIFSLTDALAARDKKNLWVLYQQALSAGFAPEQVCGTLFWKVKDMATKRPSRAWSTDALKDLSSRLVSLYHDSHRGRHDFDIALERLVLTI